MGAALLDTPELACEIIRTLRLNCALPVSAKIRLIPRAGEPEDRVTSTVRFMEQLIDAGIADTCIHTMAQSVYVMRCRCVCSDDPCADQGHVLLPGTGDAPPHPTDHR